jgi:hypothetical protein
MSSECYHPAHPVGCNSAIASCRLEWLFGALDLCFLKKAKVIRKNRKEVVWKTGIVSLGHFGANEGLTI